MNIWIWLLAPLCTILYGQGDQFDPSIQEIFHVFEGDSTFTIPHQTIIPASLEIRSETIKLDTLVYSFDQKRGVLIFHHPPDSGTGVWIRYRRLPISIPLMYRHFSISDTVKVDGPDGSDHLPVIIPTTEKSFKADETDISDLKRSGSIFRGITMGTDQGMRLESGLRLQVSGQIAPGVEVTASLTDQNTPIQPEGNTQTLQEIDKVFINISAKSLKATLGDYVFDTGASGFGTYTRKLQGAMGTAEGQWGSLTVIGAASKGQFTTNHFQGQENNQGPYQLTGDGQRDIIVLAGTERVWIDGERMVRGEDNDYIIEYGMGQITFTRNRLITADSRITVDFEYSDLKFQKSIYGALGEARFWDERLKFRTLFLRESDDKENPLDIPLTDDYKKILADAGDNPDSAITSGAKNVGSGNGNYLRIENNGVPYYQYVGNDQGDMVVRFTYVGESLGDYSFQGYGIYRYEGPGLGSYISSIFLPMARTHQMVTLQSEFEMAQGVSLAGEVGFSDLDMNQYSLKNDDDNVDHAIQGELRFLGKSVRVFGKNLGKVDFTGHVKNVGNRFRPLGRMTDVEYGRKWGTEEGVVWGEKLWEIRGTYYPVEHWLLGTEMGDFKRGDFQSQRQMVHTDFHPRSFPSIQYRIEWIQSNNQPQQRGFWLRQSGNIQKEFGIFTPSIRYEGEHRRDEGSDSSRTGFRFDEWAGRMAFVRGMISGFFEETLRKNQNYDSGYLEKESQARTDKVQLSLTPGQQFNTTFMYTHRDRDYTDPASQDQRVDLADIKMRFGSKTRWIDSQLYYQFSSTQVSELVRDTIQVDAGLGNYRLDETLQELVPDPDGDLLVRMIQTGRFTPVNDLKAGAEIDLDGSRIWQNPKGLKSLAALIRGRTLCRVERRDSERNFGKVNRAALSPRWGLDSTLVMAMISFQQDIEIQPLHRRYSIRLRYKKNDSENNQFLYENLLRQVSEQGIRIKGQPNQSTGIQVEYTYREDIKNYKTRSYSNRSISVHDWIVETSIRPKQQFEIALKSQIKYAQDIVPDPDTRAVSWFWIPRMSYAFLGRGNLRIELEIGKVSTKSENRSLPYEMLNGDQPGRTIRWNVLMTYRLSGHVMSTLNYRARKEPWRDKLYQTGQVEVRAYF